MQLYQITYHFLVSATLITYVYLLPKYNTCLIYLVVTKTGNDHKPPKTTIHDHKPPANDYKPPPNNHKLSASNDKRPNRSFPNSSYFIFLHIGNEAVICHIDIYISVFRGNYGFDESIFCRSL